MQTCALNWDSWRRSSSTGWVCGVSVIWDIGRSENLRQHLPTCDSTYSPATAPAHLRQHMHSTQMQRLPGEVWSLVLSSVFNFVPFASASRELLQQHDGRLQMQKQAHELAQERARQASGLEATLLQIDDTLALHDFGDCDGLTELRQVVADLKVGTVSVEYMRDRLSWAAAANFPPGATVLTGYASRLCTRLDARF
jgi:hypothetical protein